MGLSDNMKKLYLIITLIALSLPMQVLTTSVATAQDSTKVTSTDTKLTKAERKAARKAARKAEKAAKNAARADKKAKAKAAKQDKKAQAKPAKQDKKAAKNKRAEPQNPAAALIALERHKESLLERANVVGTGVSWDKNGEPVLKVFTTKKGK
jgi:regulator of protease activity HflC (stomatin/prohibitin superfamily)